jgi:hypothetical protein
MIKRAELDNAFVTEDWLLTYEARARGWCRPCNWKKASAWKEMKDRGVQFLVQKEQQRKSRLRRLRPAFLPIGKSLLA